MQQKNLRLRGEANARAPGVEKDQYRKQWSSNQGEAMYTLVQGADPRANEECSEQTVNLLRRSEPDSATRTPGFLFSGCSAVSPVRAPGVVAFKTGAVCRGLSNFHNCYTAVL